MATNEVRINLALQGAKALQQNLQRSATSASQARQALSQTREQLNALNTASKQLQAFRQTRAQVRQLKNALQTNAEQVKTHTAAQADAEQQQRTTRAALQAAKTQLQAHTQAVHGSASASKSQLQALAAIRKEVNKHQREYNQATESLRKHRQQARSLAQQTTQLTAQQQQATQQLGAHRERMQAAGLSTEKTAQQARRLRQETEALNHSLAQQKTALSQLGAKQAALNRAREQSRTQRNNARTGALTGLGYSYLGVRGAQGLGSFFGTGASYEATLSRVQALARLNATGPQMKALRNNARELGASTSFSANQVAGAQGFMAMGGFRPQQIIQAMPGVLDMAKAGDLGLERTADIATNIMGGFKLPAEQMGWVADTLTKTFTTSNTNLEMLGQTMKYVGPVAAGMGVDLAQAAAMAGLLGKVGLQGSDSGTALRGMLLRLSAPVGGAKTALEGLGISVADSSGNLRSVVDLLEELSYATAGMGDTEKMDILKALFGEEPAAAALTLLEEANSGGLRAYVANIRQAQGEAARVAAIMGDNLLGDIDRLKSAWDEVKIQVFGENNAVLRELVTKLTGVVGAVGTWATHNASLVRWLTKATMAGLAAVTVLGALSAAVFGLMLPLLATRFALQVLGVKTLPVLASALRLPLVGLRAVGVAIATLGRLVLLNPLGLALGALAIAAVLVYRHWAVVKAFFSGFFAELGTAFAPLTNAVNRFVGALGKGVAKVLERFPAVGQWLRNVADGFARLLGPVAATRDQLAQAGDVGATVGKVVAAGFKGVFGLPMQLVTWGMQLSTWLLEGFTEGFSAKKAELRTAIHTLVSDVKAYFTNPLGIHSPSRVFKAYGQHTLAGYREGLRAAAPQVQAQLKRVTRGLTATGASLALALPATAYSLDTRAPIRRQPAPVVAPSEPVQIHIHPAPGADAHAIAREVQRVLEERERQAQSARNGALYD